MMITGGRSTHASLSGHLCSLLTFRASFILRWMGSSSKTKPPGRDPLDIWKRESLKRNLCDETGGRLPKSHWTVCIAIATNRTEKAPSLRTVNIEQMSFKGIDFVMKRSHPTAKLLMQGQPVSFLNTHGKHSLGEQNELWRGEGTCEELELSNILDLIPHHTLTSMVSSRRFKVEQAANDRLAEMAQGVSQERLAILNKSHFTEIVQKTRVELENGGISFEEFDQSIRAFRLKPNRVEYMVGGPDSIAWDRWEWLRDREVIDPHGTSTVSWSDPKHLLPH